MLVFTLKNDMTYHMTDWSYYPQSGETVKEGDILSLHVGYGRFRDHIVGYIPEKIHLGLVVVEMMTRPTPRYSNEIKKDAYDIAIEKGYDVGIPGADHEVYCPWLDDEDDTLDIDPKYIQKMLENVKKDNS